MILPILKRAALQLRFRRHLVLPGLVISLGLFVSTHLIISCTGTRTVVAAAPIIRGAKFVGAASCASCHEPITKTFPGSVHARMHPSPGAAGVDTSCESCHGPGSRHVDAGGGTTFHRLIVNPGKSAEACFKCHVGVHAEFRLPSHHPVLEKHMNCVQCHDPHGHDIMKPAGGLGFARRNQSCAQCHREQTRHFVFEHEAMREGCTICHQPHGSVNAKLLVQRDSNLCLRCHAQVPGAGGGVVIGKMDHSFFLRQGNCSTVGCHTAVHGSNIHPKLLY
ncbi:MAG: cytochrome c3 family protein [Roseibacillus sp.]